ncbi:MAG: hypothetical protein ABI780_02275, partial [Ardenticatenales bacterium]
MDQAPPTSNESGAPVTPSATERLSAAADDVKRDAQSMYAAAATAAEQVADRLDAAAGDAREHVSQTGENVIDELRGIGSRLAAALQAAASTPEAAGLKSDLREGAQRLVNELQSAIKASPIGKIGGRTDGGDGAAPAGDSAAAVADLPSTPSAHRVASTVRAELASALRGLNRALDRLAGQLEPGAPAAVDAAAESTSTDAPT